MSRAADFLVLVVKPTAEEFLRDTGDLRRGFLAAIVLYHLADYWDQENNPTETSLSNLRQALIKKCPDFGVIRDIADASKHAELTRPSKDIPRILSSSENVKVVKDLSSDGVSIFSYGPPAVKFTLDDGSRGSLDAAVRSVLSMWEIELQ
jgi:hypothetical protein